MALTRANLPSASITSPRSPTTRLATKSTATVALGAASRALAVATTHACPTLAAATRGIGAEARTSRRTSWVTTLAFCIRVVRTARGRSWSTGMGRHPWGLPGRRWATSPLGCTRWGSCRIPMWSITRSTMNGQKSSAHCRSTRTSYRTASRFACHARRACLRWKNMHPMLVDIFGCRSAATRSTRPWSWQQSGKTKCTSTLHVPSLTSCTARAPSYGQC
mmetsp:Transcript_34486/g.83891  ORF Transcript_34486/g.83891 Transcript_34486/m.83891 type:complete len:220 (+) Transcript_34486:820-1479(+)